MKGLHRAASALFAFALLSLSCSLAHAIGDSGGCGVSPLETALKGGTPQEVEQAIQWRMDERERNAGMVQKLRDLVTSGAARQAERKEVTRRFIEGERLEGVVCSPGALLPIALTAGNLPVVRYLLDAPLGVHPATPRNILFECAHLSGSTEKRQARLDAFKLLIERGGVDLNSLDRHGRSVLEACKAPELVALYIGKGARVDVEGTRNGMPINLLERAILDAVDSAEDSPSADNAQSIERARLFAKALGTNSIRERPVESAIRHYCRDTVGREPWNPTSCRELSTFIVASKGVFAADPAGEEAGRDAQAAKAGQQSASQAPPSPKRAPVLLHVIGVYEGQTPPGVDDRPWWAKCDDDLPRRPKAAQGSAPRPSRPSDACFKKYAGRHAEKEVVVNVTDTSAPMVLALTAYDKTLWKLSIKPGVRLKRVILGGYHGQRASGLPDDVPVDVYSYEASPCERCMQRPGYFYSYQKPPEQLKDITGLEVTSFQGRYQGGAFSVFEGAH